MSSTAAQAAVHACMPFFFALTDVGMHPSIKQDLSAHSLLSSRCIIICIINKSHQTHHNLEEINCGRDSITTALDINDDDAAQAPTENNRSYGTRDIRSGRIVRSGSWLDMYDHAFH